MSKIGKIPVNIKEGVSISIEGSGVAIKGPKGELSFILPKGIKAETQDGKIVIAQERKNDIETRALFGLARAHIANMVKGVSEGFEKKLELSGVGFRAEAQGSDLTLYIGFTHPVKVHQEGVTFSVSENIINISGIDKSLVGNTAAKIRGIKPPEPYKGKGIKYVGERIRRKVGKAAKAIGTTGGGTK